MEKGINTGTLDDIYHMEKNYIGVPHLNQFIKKISAPGSLYSYLFYIQRTIIIIFKAKE